MATLTYNQLYKALKAEGLTVRKHKGSRKRCRCHAGWHMLGGRKIRPWGETIGTMVHITAGGLGGRSVTKYIDDIINGDPNVPDKAQLIIDPDGVVTINSAGRCNHAGKIGSAAVTAYRRETWSLKAAWDNLRGSSVDGNTLVWGIEVIAARAMNDVQYKSTVRTSAAIERAEGRTGRAVAGHGECSAQRGPGDPNRHMGQLRRDVMARVKRKP